MRSTVADAWPGPRRAAGQYSGAPGGRSLLRLSVQRGPGLRLVQVLAGDWGNNTRTADHWHAARSTPHWQQPRVQRHVPRPPRSLHTGPDVRSPSALWVLTDSEGAPMGTQSTGPVVRHDRSTGGPSALSVLTAATQRHWQPKLKEGECPRDAPKAQKCDNCRSKRSACKFAARIAAANAILCVSRRAINLRAAH